MKTTFTLRFMGEAVAEAGSVARECFEYLDYLENKLSRYIEGSDIWQINHMQAGDGLFISDMCHECLMTAMRASTETGGHFDITLGKLIEHVKEKSDGPLPGLAGRLVIAPDRPLITCEEPGREIDLGGIGKGFALDKMKSLMIDWGIEAAFLSAGASTHLAFGGPSWPVEMRGDSSSRTIELRNNALSSSGTAIQGSHILGPHGTPGTFPFTRVWALHETAAMADAWSTALMLMPPDGIESLRNDEISAWADSGSEIRRLAPLPG